MKEFIEIELNEKGKPTKKGEIDLMIGIAECIFEVYDREYKDVRKAKPQDQAVINNNILLSMSWFN